MKKVIAAMTLAAVLLSGCSMSAGSDKSRSITDFNSCITLKAEDEHLLTECAEIAEARLKSEYPQLECKVSYKWRDAFAYISFDRPENWNDSTLDSLCSCGKVTFRKGTDTVTDPDGNTVPAGEIVLDNNDIAAAHMELMLSDNGQEYAVDVTLFIAGSNKLAAATNELAGTDMPLSIWLDNELISAPKVNSAITDGKAVITGNFTESSALELAAAISSGALPCELKIIDKRIGDEEK